MLKRKLILSLLSIMVAASLLSIANATSYEIASKSPSAFGAGVFLHEHEDGLHTHWFAFSVSDGCLRKDGWYYKPDGKFSLVCKHPDNQICMIVKSDQITRFKVMRVEGGLNVVFEGFATVKMMDEPWQRCWRLTVEAFDYGCRNDAISVHLVSPTGVEHHMEGTLTSGNIVVKK